MTPTVIGRSPSAFRMMQTPSSTGRVLVLINLQGGYDALSMVPPIISGSQAGIRYLANRPGLSAKSGPSLHLTLPGVTGFGLHPSLNLLRNQWINGDLAIVQKAGLPSPDLSHFSAQEIMSRGRASLQALDGRGWLGRLSDLHLTNTMDIVGLGVPNRVDFNSTNRRPLVLSNLENFRTTEFIDYADNYLRRDMLNQMVSQVFSEDHRITAAARSATDSGLDQSSVIASVFSGVNLTGNYSYTGPYNQLPGTGPHEDPLARSLKDIAKLIIAPTIGTRVFYTWGIDFDTHGRQESLVVGTEPEVADRPSFTDRLNITMAALSGFIADLQAAGKWNQTAIVLFSEFGRRNFENETDGTDHGHGMHMFVLGGLVNGGLKGTTVSAADQDPAMGNANLPVDIDYREVFRQCLQNWLQLPASPAVFDDYTSPLPNQSVFNLF